MNRGNTDQPRTIVVSEARVEALAENFANTWMRPPTPRELKGLVDEYVADEVYYREAVAAGLDRDDAVIRRRLRQKMEFVTDDLAAAASPTDAQLQAYLDAHGERFTLPPSVTLEQVFISREKHGSAARAVTERLLADLRAGKAKADSSGDASLLPPRLANAAPSDVEYTFGKEFADAVTALPTGEWAGPVESGFGLHLVRVEAREAQRAPTLAEVREAVQREWEADQRKEVRDRFLAQLAAKYRVRIEGPLGDALRKSSGGPGAPRP